MLFEYLGEAKEQLNQILGDLGRFEDQVERLCNSTTKASHISVLPLRGGLSGASVFLVRRALDGRAVVPWLVKACTDTALIREERQNYVKHVLPHMRLVPNMLEAGDSNLLFFDFGGPLMSRNVQTLRAGYEASSSMALATLMERIVDALTPIHVFRDDTCSVVHRMTPNPPLPSKLNSLDPPLPQTLSLKLIDAWQKVVDSASTYPSLFSTAHGDLNSGNVLFEPGESASYPIFIDFASVERSKDNVGYPSSFHPPFWDYAKLERDIKTRLFLKEAVSAGLDRHLIFEAIRRVDCGEHPSELTTPPPISKLVTTIRALRDAIKHKHPPAVFDKCYRVSVAYATLSVFYRTIPDSDLPLDLQREAAAESVIALLSPPKADPHLPSYAPVGKSSPSTELSVYLAKAREVLSRLHALQRVLDAFDADEISLEEYHRLLYLPENRIYNDEVRQLDLLCLEQFRKVLPHDHPLLSDWYIHEDRGYALAEDIPIMTRKVLQLEAVLPKIK